MKESNKFNFFIECSEEELGILVKIFRRKIQENKVPWDFEGKIMVIKRFITIDGYTFGRFIMEDGYVLSSN